MDQEIWKDIDGFEKLYQISNYGRVFSKRRNKRILKRDRDLVGFIFKHPKTKKYAFMTEDGHCMSADSMTIVNTFMGYLDRKMIKFNPEKGELSGSKNFRIPKEYENDK